MDLNEAKKALMSCLDDPIKKEYISLLRKWILLGSSTKDSFDKSARDLLTTEEQVHHHNILLIAIVSELNPNRQITDGSGYFVDGNALDNADYQEYIQQSKLEFMPDSGFMSCRIAIVSWENGMHGADKAVTELLIHACQAFVKNIITAMISRKKGYKIRDHKFQYGFNLPILDPFKRNSSIVEDVQVFSDDLVKKEAELQDLVKEEPKFKKMRKNNELPRSKQCFSSSEQQAAFSCAKKKNYDNLLTTALLYETLRENPKILGLHGIQSVSMLKLGLQFED